MTATQDRQEGLEAVSDEIPWRDRSAFGSLRGVPWWGAVLIALCVSIAGAVADLIASGSLSTAFEGAFVIGCVAAVALARRRSLFGPIVQPPLILLVTVPAVVLLTKPPSGGLTAKALAVGTPLINSFPTMAIATGLTVVIGVVRLLVQRKPAGASDEEPAPRARRKKPAAPAKRRAPAASGKANAKAKASGKTRAAAADRSGKDRAAKDQAGKECNVVELQGTTGSSPAINRKKGFEEAIAGTPTIKIIRSQTGDFTRAKGKEVMEGFLKAENGGKNICALYAHNDDMAVGAIQAIKEAGLKPGTDIKVVSIDSVPDIFQALAAGEANATVELTPNMAGPAFDALEKLKKDGTVPPKTIITESKLYTQADDPMKVYEEKKGLGY